MGEQCKRVATLWQGCRFEPRYDERMGPIPPGARFDDHTALDYFRVKEYVCDVCVRCGRVIDRKDAAP